MNIFYRGFPALLLIFAVCCSSVELLAVPNNRLAANKTDNPKIQSKFITVKVTGSGETLALAHKNAKDNAITEVVGMALRSENVFSSHSVSRPAYRSRSQVFITLSSIYGSVIGKAIAFTSFSP